MSKITTETAVGFCIIGAIAIFLYMALHIGVFRWNTDHYASYILYFNHASGLKKKDMVTIAGVKVGWIDEVDFEPNRQKVRVKILILKDYSLHADAYGVVRQDGFLGGKHMELVPGQPGAPCVSSGSELVCVGREPVSMDAVLEQVKVIASHVEEVTRSLRDTFGGKEGAQLLQDTMRTVHEVSQHLARVTETLEGLMTRNERSVDGIVRDVGTVAGELKERIPALLTEMKELTARLTQTLAPTLETSIKTVSESVDQNLTRAADTLSSVGGQITEVAEKINKGTGVLGELINDSDTSKDVKTTIQSLRTMLSRMDKMTLIFDPHSESMLQHTNQVPFKDTKGYFDVRLFPQEDYFYLIGLVGRRSGRIVRRDKHQWWFTGTGEQLNPDTMPLTPGEKLAFAPNKYTATRELDHWVWNLQFGKIYGNFAIRFGLFESTAGVGIDYTLSNDWFKWITTFEAYDFQGQLRIDDTRPHLKWLNRLFITRNLYFVAGIDDFVSDGASSAFVGAGLRFDDDDLKYLFARANVTV